MKTLAKKYLPQPLVRWLRSVKVIAERLGWWLAVFREVRGATASDQWSLIRSAARSTPLLAQEIDAWTNPKSAFDLRVNVAGVGLFNVVKNTDDLWHVLPAREKAVLGFIRDHLNSGGVFVDAGANIGFYSVLAARIVGPAGRIYAFEMMPDTAKKLRSNLLLNKIDTAKVVQMALAAKSGATVTAKVSDGLSGQASIMNLAKHEKAQSLEVETISLDEALSDVGVVDLIKLDLEGAEELALDGATSILSRTRAIIFENIYHSPVPAIFEKLSSAGFSVSEIDRSNAVALKRQTSQ